MTFSLSLSCTRVDEASTKCGYPSFLIWLSFSQARLLSARDLQHRTWRLRLSRSASLFLATELLSARGRAPACSGPCCESSDGSFVPIFALVESGQFSAQPLDHLVKLFFIIFPLGTSFRLLFSLKSHAPCATERQCLLEGEPVRILGKTSTEGLVKKNANHPDSSEAGTQKVQKTVMITQVRDREHCDAFSQLEADMQLSRTVES